MNPIIIKILDKEKITFKKIVKSNVGFTSAVFFVDDKYVLKLVLNSSQRKIIAKEISVYKNLCCLNFIPKYVASGVFDDAEYLIIEKIKGQSLYSIWHALSNNERENISDQIIQIFKTFHAQKYDFLDKQFVNENWVETWQKELENNINLLQKANYDVSGLITVKNLIAPIIFKEQNLCIIHNDMHFDNLIYDGKKLYLIDFDRVQVASKDYELLIFKSMCDRPRKFANEETESFVKEQDYVNLYSYVMKGYPNMFEFKYLQERMFVYWLLYELENAYEYKNNSRIIEIINTTNEFIKKMI